MAAKNEAFAARYSRLMKTFKTLADVAACVGQDVALSDWITVTQQQVNLFATPPVTISGFTLTQRKRQPGRLAGRLRTGS